MKHGLIEWVVFVAIMLPNIYMFFKKVKVLRTPEDQLDSLMGKPGISNWGESDVLKQRREFKKRARQIVVGYVILFVAIVCSFIW